MILTRLLFEDNLMNVQFFKKTFLLANTSIKVILGMSFLSFDKVNVKLAKMSGKLIWRSYTVVEILLTTR